MEEESRNFMEMVLDSAPLTVKDYTNALKKMQKMSRFALPNLSQAPVKGSHPPLPSIMELQTMLEDQLRFIDSLPKTSTINDRKCQNSKHNIDQKQYKGERKQKRWKNQTNVNTLYYLNKCVDRTSTDINPLITNPITTNITTTTTTNGNTNDSTSANPLITANNININGEMASVGDQYNVVKSLTYTFPLSTSLTDRRLAEKENKEEEEEDKDNDDEDSSGEKKHEMKSKLKLKMKEQRQRKLDKEADKKKGTRLRIKYSIEEVADLCELRKKCLGQFNMNHPATIYYFMKWNSLEKKWTEARVKKKKLPAAFFFFIFFVICNRFMIGLTIIRKSIAQLKNKRLGGKCAC